MEASAPHRPPSPTSLGRRVLGIIDEAWRRARRRRIGIMVGLVTLGAVVAFLVLRGNTESATEPASGAGGIAVATTSSMIRGTPYMGVACSAPDALICDRVGLQVRLNEPAKKVTATLAGMSFPLTNPDWGPDPGGGPVKRFTGFLEHAGLRTPGQLHVLEKRQGHDRWLESAPSKHPVTLRIEREAGTIQTTQLRVWLAGGWG